LIQVSTTKLAYMLVLDLLILWFDI
jgi:hypothetical protein